MARTRVLVVDDSAFARKVVREVLAASPLLEVVGIARDGLEALEKIAELKPDVVTLDLVMPELDGLGVLKALPARGGPRVVVVSMSDAQSDLAIEALASGAIDFVHKPTSLATERLYDLAGELVAKVLLANSARPRPPSVRERLPDGASSVKGTRLLAIGASTGGPQALTRIAEELPGDLPVPVAMCVHLPAGYTEAFAARLDQLSALTVVEAREDLPIDRGMIVIARGGMHLRVEERNGVLRARVSAEPSSSLHRPSVNELFTSAAAAFGDGVLAAVLTGMGDDGLEGARAIRKAGGRVITESESSCVVYGMPRCIDEAGLSLGNVPIEQMAAELVRRL